LKVKITINDDAKVIFTKEEVLELYRDDAVPYHQSARRKMMDAIVSAYLYKGISIRDEFLKSITPK
jgi:hypothetical protein